MNITDFRESSIGFKRGKSYEINIVNENESSCLVSTVPSDEGTYISFELLFFDQNKLNKYISSKPYSDIFLAEKESVAILNLFINTEKQVKLNQLASYLSANGYNLIPIAF